MHKILCMNRKLRQAWGLRRRVGAREVGVRRINRQNLSTSYFFGMKTRGGQDGGWERCGSTAWGGQPFCA